MEDRIANLEDRISLLEEEKLEQYIQENSQQNILELLELDITDEILLDLYEKRFQYHRINRQPYEAPYTSYTIKITCIIQDFKIQGLALIDSRCSTSKIDDKLIPIKYKHNLERPIHARSLYRSKEIPDNLLY